MMDYGRRRHYGAEAVRARVPTGVGDDSTKSRLSQQPCDQRPVRAVRKPDIGQCHDALLTRRLTHRTHDVLSRANIEFARLVHGFALLAGEIVHPQQDVRVISTEMGSGAAHMFLNRLTEGEGLVPRDQVGRLWAGVHELNRWCSAGQVVQPPGEQSRVEDRKSTRLNSSHSQISYAV